MRFVPNQSHGKNIAQCRLDQMLILSDQMRKPFHKIQVILLCIHKLCFLKWICLAPLDEPGAANHVRFAKCPN